MAIAYHFINDFDTVNGVYEGIRSTYDGRLILTVDMMVWNVTEEGVEVREVIYNENVWTAPVVRRGEVDLSRRALRKARRRSQLLLESRLDDRPSSGTLCSCARVLIVESEEHPCGLDHRAPLFVPRYGPQTRQRAVQELVHDRTCEHVERLSLLVLQIAEALTVGDTFERVDTDLLSLAA